MRVLIACEFSGIVRDAFLERGHNAMSCDLLPTERPGPHYRGDVFDVLNDGWDLMIAHPPCTYLANSGVRWLHEQEDRWEAMEDGARFFYDLLHADIPRIAVENPVMHKYAVRIVGRKQDQCVQPWQFGHPESKRTCFWLKNLPLLQPTSDVREKMEQMTNAQRQRLHWLPPSADRWKLRSLTYSGIATAMADQWGSL